MAEVYEWISKWQASTHLQGPDGILIIRKGMPSISKSIAHMEALHQSTSEGSQLL